MYYSQYEIQQTDLALAIGVRVSAASYVSVVKNQHHGHLDNSHSQNIKQKVVTIAKLRIMDNVSTSNK